MSEVELGAELVEVLVEVVAPATVVVLVPSELVVLVPSVVEGSEVELGTELVELVASEVELVLVEVVATVVEFWLLQPITAMVKIEKTIIKTNLRRICREIYHLFNRIANINGSAVSCTGETSKG